MSILYIAISTFLIATVNSKSTSAPDLDYNNEYYDEDIAADAQDNALVNMKSNEIASLPPEFITSPQVITAKLGDRVTLDCEAKNAESYETMWKKNGEQLSLGTLVYEKGLYSVMDNSTLVIEHIKPSSSGDYSCIILMSSNASKTLTHRLKLENAAEIISLHAEDNHTQLNTGDTLMITCQVKGKPLPGIKWYFNGRDSPSSIHMRGKQTQQDSNTITIENVNLKHSGTYRCLADNGESTAHQSITIDVFGFRGKEIPSSLEEDKGRTTTATTKTKSYESRVSENSGSLHLVPSITLLITTYILMNQ